MKQAQFEQEHAALWSALEEALARPKRGAAPLPLQRLPAQYRALCQCLALAEQRGYAPGLTGYLRNLALRCHRRLYGAVAERPAALAGMLVAVPRRVRAEWRLLVLVLALFLVPALGAALLIWDDPQRAFWFQDPAQLDAMHKMYLPANTRLGRGGSAGDVAMFGFYIWNNVSICFRTFAGGMMAGVPALVSVAGNGLNLGVVGAWLSLDPATRATFWSFVVTHASFEMTGLVLAGMSGLRMGLALLRPGRLTRRYALQVAGQAAFPLLAGAALLTVVAAFFEAFWSAQPTVAPALKYGVGGACWLAVLAYLGLAGRGRTDAH
jgi:uncharacterized membrane protein SpoIIM required for sporulation